MHEATLMQQFKTLMHAQRVSLQSCDCVRAK